MRLTVRKKVSKRKRRGRKTDRERETERQKLRQKPRQTETVSTPRKVCQKTAIQETMHSETGTFLWSWFGCRS